MAHSIVAPLLLALTTLMAVAPGAATAGAATADDRASSRRERVAFEREGQVWLLDAGAPERPVARGGCPALSPDGTRLAFCRVSGRVPDGGPDTVVTRPLAQGPERVWVGEETPGVVGDLAWSPDDERLAFLFHLASGGNEVRLLDPAGGRAVPVPLERGRDPASLWGLAWAPDGRSLVAHDMSQLLRFTLDGHVLERIPLPELTGARIEGVTSSDRYVPSPRDGTLYAYTGSVPGTARFEAVMHEPNTALFLHDRFLGRGKNLRLTGKEVTAFDPVWSADGEYLYFTGYRDTQAREPYPFRILRVHRTGRGLREIARGERPSVARGHSGFSLTTVPSPRPGTRVTGER